VPNREHDLIVRLLREASDQELLEVSDRTGLSVRTMYRIRKAGCIAKLTTLAKLSDFFAVPNG